MDRREMIDRECEYMKGLAKGLYTNVMRFVEILKGSRSLTTPGKELDPEAEMKIRAMSVDDIKAYVGIIAAGIGSCERIRAYYKGEYGEEMDCSGCEAVKDFKKMVEAYSSTFNE